MIIQLAGNPDRKNICGVRLILYDFSECQNTKTNPICRMGLELYDYSIIKMTKPVCRAGQELYNYKSAEYDVEDYLHSRRAHGSKYPLKK